MPQVVSVLGFAKQVIKHQIRIILGTLGLTLRFQIPDNLGSDVVFLAQDKSVVWIAHAVKFVEHIERGNGDSFAFERAPVHIVSTAIVESLGEAGHVDVKGVSVRDREGFYFP